MRESVFCLIAILFLMSCANNNDAPTPDALRQLERDSGLNPPSQNQNTTKKDSIAVSDVPSLEQAFNQNPSQENAFELAYAYAETKNKKAIWFTDTLIKYGRKEDIGFAWYAKGLYYQNVGDVQKALKLYDSSIVADYTLLDTYRDKGQLQFSLKQHDAALKTFAQGRSLAKDLSAKAEFLYWAAKCFEALGDKRNAKDNYESAYALDKTLVEAKAAADKL